MAECREKSVWYILLYLICYEFYNYTQSSLKSKIESALNSLQKELLIKYYDPFNGDTYGFTKEVIDYLKENSDKPVITTKNVLEIYNLKTNQLETRFVYYLESLREIKNNILC